MIKFDDAFADLRRACATLDVTQGRIARRNARARVKAATKKLLGAMDAEFPLVRKERVVRVSMSPLAKKRRERARRMTTAHVSTSEALTLTSLGIKCQGSSEHSAPLWAVRFLRANIGHKVIQASIRSMKKRREVEALLRLRGKSL